MTTTVNPAVRTRRIRLALRAAGIEIFACFGEGYCTIVRVPNPEVSRAVDVLTAAGWSIEAGGHSRELVAR